MTFKPIKCSKCGIKDVSKYGHIGTSVKMKCPDCATEESKEFATFCRNCCPTEHGTKWVKE